MNRGSKLYVGTGETTEWEDILIKKGIIAPKTKVTEEEDYESEDDVDPREDATLDELDEMEASIVVRRIAEMKAQMARNVFGDIQPISKDEWTREVTEASKGSWVVAYLWENSVEECKLMDQILRVIAGRHRDVKFVSIQSQVCVENWPLRNLPTLFIYKDGNLATQMLTLSKLKGLNTRVEGNCSFFLRAVVDGLHGP
ncbi:hypothetical protein DYB25_010649 [Aphanomyces astaci]|uniref:Phosducin domain-containing protein n=1 Tax=Aphanomyces astaci TaxID=112090 RepID=A0A397BFP0_APHAT|nr:hypothetical protein DYB25_010649 [Aphanomyces astaci]RHY19509.1 hypothetical protein DYB36_010636 [Aphanomyces astaci]RHY43199.1 hypothetical protein DYB38_011473 [Aphanomyces astaci]RHY46408.1 hypothetical protein DYB30_012345 [Aphanomyces astaci]RHY64158.1 hypothetical protein DYB34_010815 [Aphanomyces astaci]